MKKILKISSLLACCFFMVGVAYAASPIKIDTSKAPYNQLSNVVGTDNYSDETIQTAGATQVAAAYRLINGPESLPLGTEFVIIWQDSSQETIIIDSTTSSLGAVPVPNTQKEPGGGPGRGGSGGDGGGSGGGGGGGGGGGYNCVTAGGTTTCSENP